MSFWKALFRIHDIINALDEILDLVESRRPEFGGVGSISPNEILEILRRNKLIP